jgi:hypothetical protein
LECNLFSPQFDTPGKFPNIGIYVIKKNDIWEVYICERGSADLECVFYTESALYEYIFCYYKKFFDINCWF